MCVCSRPVWSGNPNCQEPARALVRTHMYIHQAAGNPALQNMSLSVAERVEALLQQLTPQQKVAQLQSRPENGIPELGVPAFNWQVSRLVTGSCSMGRSRCRCQPAISAAVQLWRGGLRRHVFPLGGTMLSKLISSANPIKAGVFNSTRSSAWLRCPAGGVPAWRQSGRPGPRQPVGKCGSPLAVSKLC